MRFIFSVKDKEIEKVFAIFNNPCYNIKVERKSKKIRLLSLLALRAGLAVGCALFIAAVAISNAFVLKIEVDGSGSYLEPQVKSIVFEEGGGIFKRFSSLNFSTATGRILSLPQVTFCNIERHGSVLKVDVRVDGEQSSAVKYAPLISDCDGVVKKIVAVCGTAAVEQGASVKKGSVLIYANTFIGEEKKDCLAVGYAEIECVKSGAYFAEEDSEENLKKAYSSMLLQDGQIIKRLHKVKPTDGGVTYELEFTYLHRVSINLT